MKTDELNELLERSLKAEPGYVLPADFAKKVTASLVRKEQWKSDLYDYFFLVACLLMILVTVAGIYYFADKQFFVRTLTFLKNNYIPVLFFLLILNFILLADRVLLRLLFSRFQKNAPKMPNLL